MTKSKSIVQCAMKEVENIAFSIGLTENEKNIVNGYAKLHYLSLGKTFKQVLFKKIE